jgi:hypothetical protein
MIKKKIATLRNLLYVGNPYYSNKVLKSKSSRLKANKRAVELVGLNKSSYTEDEKRELAKYTGSGGLGADGTAGSVDEYYTPKEVSKALFNLVDIEDGATFLEPSCGTGNIIAQAPQGVSFLGCDYNKISGSIANILNDNADIKAGTTFEEYSKTIKLNSIDSIVTNVPFGARESVNMSSDEQYKNIKRNEIYFILKSLDLLKYEKKAVFMTTSRTIQGKNYRSDRLEMLKKGAFLGAYRLPSGMFKQTGTDVVVDIIVFEKHPEKIILKPDAYIDGILDNELQKEFLNGTYFSTHKNNVFGELTTKEERLENGESGKFVSDVVELKDGQTIETVKHDLLTKSKFDNTIDYSTLIQEKVVKSDTVDEEELESKLATIMRDEISQVSVSGEPELTFEDIVKYEKQIRDNKLDKLLKRSLRYFSIRRFSHAFGTKENLANYFLFLDGTEYSKDFIIENKDGIEYLLANYEKIVKSLKLKGKVKNEVIATLETLKNFDLDNGVFKDTYEELERSVKLEKQNVFFKLGLEDKVSYEDGGLVVNTSELTIEDIENNDEILQVGKKVYILKEYLFSLPSRYDEALENVSENKNITQSEKNKLFKELSNRREVIKYDDITFRLADIKGYGIAKYGWDFSKEMGKITENYLALFKKTISEDFPEVKYDALMKNLSDSDRDIINSFLSAKCSIGNMQYKRGFATNYFSGKDVKGSDKDKKVAIDKAISIVKVALSENMVIADETARLLVARRKDIQEDIQAKLDSEAIVSLETPSYYEEELTELKDTVRPEVLKTSHHYQNSDAREFAKTLKGTIAQGTGLGKTRSALLSAIKAIQSGNAKRVMIATPKTVFTKFINEAKSVYKEEFFNNNVVVSNIDMKANTKKEFPNFKDYTELSRYVMNNKSTKIIIVAHPFIDSALKMKPETTSYLYNNKKTTRDETATIYEFPLADIGIEAYNHKDYEKNGKLYFENLGVDFLLVDEAQNYKNVFSMKGDIKGVKGKSSAKAVKLAYVTEYIRMKRDGGKSRSGAVMVSATPTTSSPQEIFANMTLSGANNRQMTAQDFIDRFCEVGTKESVKPSTGDLSSEERLVGIRNIKQLDMLGWDKTVFRNAEDEQLKALERGKVVKVKPDYTENRVDISVNPKLVQTISHIRKQFEDFKDKAKEMRENGEDGIDLTTAEYRMSKQVGEVFGFFTKANASTMASNFAYGFTPIMLNKKYSIDELLKVVGKVNIDIKIEKFNRLKQSYDLNYLNSITFDEEINIIPTKETPIFAMQPILNYGTKIVQSKIARGNGLNTFVQTSGDGDIFQLPSKDYETITKVIKLLKTAKMIDSDSIYDLDAFTKVKPLIEKMKNEFTRHPKAKQVIYVDNLAYHSILESALNAEFPKSKVTVYNGVTIKSDEKGFKEQTDFNDSQNPGIMIFNKKAQVGVDFNKFVSAVHLLDIPNTPDQWEQAMGRSVRQGNDIDKVNVYKYIQNGSFDDFMIDLIDSKSDWIDTISKRDKDSVKIETDEMSMLYTKAIGYFEDKEFATDWDDARKINEYKKIRKEKEQTKLREIEKIVWGNKKDDLKEALKLKSTINRMVENERIYVSNILNIPYASLNYKIDEYVPNYIKNSTSITLDVIKFIESKIKSLKSFPATISNKLSDGYKNFEDIKIAIKTSVKETLDDEIKKSNVLFKHIDEIEDKNVKAHIKKELKKATKKMTIEDYLKSLYSVIEEELLYKLDEAENIDFKVSTLQDDVIMSIPDGIYAEPKIETYKAVSENEKLFSYRSEKDNLIYDVSKINLIDTELEYLSIVGIDRVYNINYKNDLAQIPNYTSNNICKMVSDTKLKELILETENLEKNYNLQTELLHS